MYYPEKSYNGVLFLLREPHVSKEDIHLTKEEITEKSNRWVDKMLKDAFTETDWKDAEERKVSKTVAAKYRNRFCEILSFIGKNEEQLSDIAYHNMYVYGGGAVQSKEYKKYIQTYTQSNFETLLKKLGYRTRYIFTCRDIYIRLKALLKITDERNGLWYKNKEYPFKCFFYTDSKFNKVTVFEMFHPSYYARLKDE